MSSKFIWNLSKSKDKKNINNTTLPPFQEEETEKENYSYFPFHSLQSVKNTIYYFLWSNGKEEKEKQEKEEK